MRNRFALNALDHELGIDPLSKVYMVHCPRWKKERSRHWIDAVRAEVLVLLVALVLPLIHTALLPTSASLYAIISMAVLFLLLTLLMVMLHY